MQRDYERELAGLFEGMDAERRAWAIAQIRAMLLDVKADLMLAEALGPSYKPMDLRTWQPSCPPPGESLR